MKKILTTIVLCVFLIGFTASEDESANKTNPLFDIPNGSSAEYVLDNQDFEGTPIQSISRIVLYSSYAGCDNYDCHIEGVSFWGAFGYDSYWTNEFEAQFQNKIYKYHIIGTGIPYATIDLYVAPNGVTWICYDVMPTDQTIAKMMTNTRPVGKLRRVN